MGLFTSDYALLGGGDSRLFRYNGATIERCDTENWWIRPLAGVSGTNSRVYACGEEGFVYLYDADFWSEIAQPTTEDLLDIVAFDDDDICVLSYGEAFHFDGVDWETSGQSGVYFYRLKAGRLNETRKMILLR